MWYLWHLFWLSPWPRPIRRTTARVVSRLPESPAQLVPEAAPAAAETVPAAEPSLPSSAAPVDDNLFSQRAREMETLIAAIQRAQGSDDPQERTALQALCTTHQALTRLLAEPENAAAPAPHHFVVDSLFLLEAYDHVCGQSADPAVAFKEIFTYITGMPLDATTFVLTHLVPVAFAEQSAVGVRVDHGSNIQTLAALDDLGLPLVAHCHSHPSHGPEANRPSDIDRRFQARLEQGGHICVGLIFSRGAQPGEGYLRFFAGDQRRFTVEIHGYHVEEIEKNVYKVDLAHRHLPLRPPASGRPVRIGR